MNNENLRCNAAIPPIDHEPGITMMKMATVVVFGLLWAMAMGVSAADTGGDRQFTFAWPFAENDDMKPRGGTTDGPDVTLVREPTDDWQAIHQSGLEKVERDRRAILAMAGGYRTSFNFVEAAGFTPGYTPARPYQSWATEYVYVITNRDDWIRLQHVMVLLIKQDDGTLSEPIVMKHWRQDWRYEDRDLRTYAGDNVWQHERLSARAAQGTWSQAVYQVDDSPRYESYGTWVHHDNYSSWESATTWRPLPRREFSVRDDYDVLVGTNRHTITPTGWVHEADNLKVALAEPGEYRADNPILAREHGVNRYERITDHDFSAGDAYWQRTAPFWADVRQGWQAIYAEHARFHVKPEIDGERLFEVMFNYAAQIDSARSYDQAAGQRFVKKTLNAFVEPR